MASLPLVLILEGPVRSWVRTQKFEEKSSILPNTSAQQYTKKIFIHKIALVVLYMLAIMESW